MKNILILLSVPVTLIIYYLATTYLISNSEARGQFGDMFGGVNALFSGLAFLGIIYTIYLQKRELSLQREELKLTRDELKRSAQAQEKSERALSKQAESLKMTAKLNGLSSIMQYEIAKNDKDNSLGGTVKLTSLWMDKNMEVEVILNEIKSIISEK